MWSTRLASRSLPRHWSDQYEQCNQQQVYCLPSCTRIAFRIFSHACVLVHSMYMHAQLCTHRSAAAESTASNRTLALPLHSCVGYVLVCHAAQLLPHISIRVASTLGSCCNRAEPSATLASAMLLLLAHSRAQLQPVCGLNRRLQTLGSMFATICVHFHG